MEIESRKVARLCGIRSSDGAYEKYPVDPGILNASKSAATCEACEIWMWDRKYGWFELLSVDSLAHKDSSYNDQRASLWPEYN